MADELVDSVEQMLVRLALQIQRGGAETGLEAETSKNLSFGTVIQPSFGPDFGNFSLAVDFFRVEVFDGPLLMSDVPATARIAEHALRIAAAVPA